MEQGVSVVTCTGDRPEAFTLCRKYVKRQTYNGLLQWVITDDGVVPTETPFLLNNGWSVTPIRMEPNPGQNTLARNLSAALQEVQYEKVVVFEDDDFYSPRYVELMAAALNESLLVGETPSTYYHVPTRKYRLMESHGRAVCQTAFRAELIPVLQSICRNHTDFIDTRFWDHINQKQFLRSHFCVGMKGLPGRPGIGVGHNPAGPCWNPDPDLAFLRAWIGNDVNLYKEFML